MAVWSETDDLPLGAVRVRWEKNALAEKDRRKDEDVARHRDEIIGACSALAERLSKNRGIPLH